MIFYSIEIDGEYFQCSIHYTPDDGRPPLSFKPLSSHEEGLTQYICEDLKRRAEESTLPGLSPEKCEQLLDDIESGIVFYKLKETTYFYKLYNKEVQEIPENAQPFMRDGKSTEKSFRVFDDLYREGFEYYGWTYEEFKSVLHNIHNGEVYFQTFSTDDPNLPEDAIPLCSIPKWEHNRIINEINLMWNKYELNVFPPENQDSLTMGEAVLKIPGLLFNAISSLIKTRPSMPTFDGAITVPPFAIKKSA